MLLAGCQSEPPSADLILKVEPGLDRREVERRLGQGSEHQVTAAVDGENIVVTTHNVSPWVPMFYVYRDGRFEKVVDGMRSATEVSSFEGTPWFRPVPQDPETRLQAILAAPSLTDDAIAERIAERRRDEAYAKQFLEPSALWPAIIITAPLYPFTLPRIMSENARDRDLARRFDPWLVRIGMSVDEVVAIYGAPKVVLDEGGSLVRTYGEHESCIAVHFQDGHVTRVFSHKFFDHSLVDAVRTTYTDDARSDDE